MGGNLVLGTYDCRKIQNQWRQIFNGKSVDNWQYKYGSKSGKIDIFSRLDLWNSNSDEDEFACFMRVKVKTGESVIYGENDCGLGIDKTICVQTGKNTLPSSAETKTQSAKKATTKTAADAKARRFKWVTAPGKGEQLNQIQANFHASELEQSSGSNLDEDWVLLLKDGWAYQGLKVSPADLDISASRKDEPNE